MSSTQSSYYQIREFSARLGEQTIQVVSKPGIPHWDAVSPASLLLAEAVEPADGDRALLIGCGHGALGVALSRRARAGEVALMDVSCIAAAMARRTLRANAVANARVCESISVLPEQAGTFDVVAIEAPSDRKLARRWLAEARDALKDGGRLYVAGANDHGIRSTIADAAALFGGAPAIAYKRGHRVALARKTSDSQASAAWAGAPGIAPGTWHEFDALVRGHTLRMRSLPGVFAYDRIDEGTALLLEALDLPARARVLDVGCGHGIIGLLAARLGAAHVDLVDANLLAVAAANENCARNGVASARALASDGVPAGSAQQYDVVVTNPPFHVGKVVAYEVAHAFLARARQALRPGGQIWLVANQFIRYDQLLGSAFEAVTCVAKTRSYRVWKATA